MKIFYKEFAKNYNSYSFGFSIYSEYKHGESLCEQYEKGFLPYSGGKTEEVVFYLARSFRVPAENFQMSSENKRVYKKFENRFSKKVENICDEDFKNLFLKYFETKHGSGVMSKERLDFILNLNIANRFVKYFDGVTLVGCVLSVETKKLRHFWYSAYDTEKDLSNFGMYMMLDEMLDVQKDGKESLYIGTGYGEKAKYKMNFENIEFFNGNIWSADSEQLKRKILEDNLSKVDFHDEFKGEIDIF